MSRESDNGDIGFKEAMQKTLEAIKEIVKECTNKDKDKKNDQ